MNEFLCKLTGGHRYSPNRTISAHDSIRNQYIMIDTCSRCGHQIVNYIADSSLKRSDFLIRRQERKSSTPYYERRSIGMKEFIAKNPKQLDICLRLLYAEKVHFSVVVKETEKHKIEYGIGVHADEKTVELLREKYRILTS